MKLACSTWNFTEELEAGSLDLPGLFGELARAGCDGVEIMGYHLEAIDEAYLRGLRKQAAAQGLDIAALDARNLRLGSNWADYRTDIAMIKLWIRAAAILGCPTVVAFLGGFEAEGQKQRLRDLAALRECAAFAQDRGVRLGVENHRIYLTTAAVDPAGREAEDLAWLMARLDSRTAGTVPDTDNVYRAQYPGLSSGERSRTLSVFAGLLRWAVHAHVKIKGSPEADEPLQFAPEEVLSVLRTGGYSGDLGFEFMKPVVGDKMLVLGQTVAAYRRALAKEC